MANDISHARPLFDLDRSSFRQGLTASAASRNLPGAMIIDKDRNILESAQTGIQQTFTTPEPDFLKGVNENEPQIAVFIEANYVAAVIRLRNFTDTFLYVARVLDPRVVAQLRQTQASVADAAQSPRRIPGTPVVVATQAVPFQRRAVPVSPATQTSPADDPSTAYRFLFVPEAASTHAEPSQRRTTPWAAAAYTLFGAEPQTPRKSRRWPVPKRVQVPAASRCKATPLGPAMAPTAQTSPADRPQTAYSATVTPDVSGVQALPSQRRIVPPSPTAQALPAGPAHTPRNTRPAPPGTVLHPAPSQRRITPFPPAQAASAPRPANA
jgi:hypothetical protein